MVRHNGRAWRLGELKLRLQGGNNVGMEGSKNGRSVAATTTVMSSTRKRPYPYPEEPSESEPNHRRTKPFPSYLDSPGSLSPTVKTLCHIIATTPSHSIEQSLHDSSLSVTSSDVEQVLKLSYAFPAQAVKFFRWSGRHHLSDCHSPYSWNLVVDLLGKNRFFDAMWDAIKSMKKERLLSLATFASVFSSYVAAGRVQDAVMTFEVMGNYGCVNDVVALNSLLSAVCRDARTLDANEFFQMAKKLVRPDADSYAILMEGWEREGNVNSAKETFAEMVIEVGWNPANVPAHDSLLCTLIRGEYGIREAIKFFDSMRDRKCYPGMRFFKVALDECVKDHDVRTAEYFWEVLVGKARLKPNTQLYNSMIALYCYHNDMDAARRLFDEMIFNGAFPDSFTYNLLFRFLIKGRKLREAGVVFAEMVKNECVPDQPNCEQAVRIYINDGDAFMAMKVWKCMADNYQEDLKDTANLLILGLCDLNRVPEAVKYAEDMIERGIKLTSSTLSKLKQSLVKERKEFVYEELLRKWKRSH
ncbi:hypothetical protein PIB30_030949 [Stylosanthes scabra]|uniref:Pentatricopeptide repeat-containing protein n=1 Tax=Stylosanthes scabra TaxID=79078 RepID=A0ABU6RBW6_9FABA|nr:hypothetical protein [Stylosanthes scabra]